MSFQERLTAREAMDQPYFSKYFVLFWLLFFSFNMRLYVFLLRIIVPWLWYFG